MLTEHNEELTGIVIDHRIDTQPEAKTELLRIRDKLHEFQPQPFYYNQSMNPIMELDDLMEAMDCLHKGDYIIMLHKVEIFFAISDFNCPAIYLSVISLLERV